MPVQKLKFPSQPGDGPINRLRVEIDVANRDVPLSSGAVGCEVWAVAIDWIGAKYQATSPVVLVHGINSSGAVWGTFRDGPHRGARRVGRQHQPHRPGGARRRCPPAVPNIPYNNRSRTTSAS